MKKLLVLLIIFFYTSTLFGAYDVKLGVYKNAKNLRINIAKIKNSKYKKQIIIEKRGRLHYLHAVVDSNKEARNALRAYKRVFKDAFISKQQVASRKKVKKVPSVVAKLEKPMVKAEITPKVKQEEPKSIVLIDAKALLADKTIYLCYENGPKHLQDRVVKMIFEKDYVTYNPLKKMSTPVKMPYTFTENNLTLELSGMNITHNLYNKDAQFIQAKSVIDGLVINKLRYYFDEAAAISFVSKTKTQHLDQIQN